MAATWDPIAGEARSVRSIQALTETPPATLDPSAGIGFVMDEVGQVTFYLDAGDGETITGEGGKVDVYVHDCGLWAYDPDQALIVPPGSLGKRRVVLGTRILPHGRGRLAFFANGIQVSGSVVAIDAVLSSVGGRK